MHRGVAACLFLGVGSARNLTSRLSWGLGSTKAVCAGRDSSAGWLEALAKATVGFWEEEQAMKAQGFLETLWYFSPAWPQNSRTGEDFLSQEARTISHPVTAILITTRE